MTATLPIIHHNSQNSCSACTSWPGNSTTTVNHIPSTSNLYENERKCRLRVPTYLPENVYQNQDKHLSTTKSSMTRQSVSYRQICENPNNFNKNSAKSLRRRGALFQPGRTNCNQRTNR